MLQPRQYQKDAINELWGYWNENPKGAPLIVAPTGSGKSAIIALIIQQISVKYPKFRFLVVTHTKELVSQNAKELQRLTTEPIGVYSAGLGLRQLRRVTFAGIQSIYKKPVEADLVIVDEAHLISRDESSMYQKLLSGIQAKNKNVRILGMTATPYRMDQGSLISEGSIFTDIAYDISIRSLIEQGFLAHITSHSKKAVDLTGVRTSGYDYNQGDLESAFNRESLIELHCKDILEVAKERQHILIFCSGIKHSEEVARKFVELGVSAEHVNGEMCNWDRDLRINKFKEGKVRILCNVGILTTGFNYKAVDCIVLLRSTKSASLYIQMVGRGTRTEAGKKDCLVLDYGGNIDRHGPIDAISVKTSKKEKAEVSVAPHKNCPICGCVVPIKTSTCPSCGYTYPDNTKVLEIKPSKSAILSEPETHIVNARIFSRHEKEGKPDSMKIQYSVGNGGNLERFGKKFFDFLCFDHGGYATSMAGRKWLAIGGGLPIPKSVEQALSRASELPEVESITVIKKDKYFEILRVKTISKDTNKLPEIVKVPDINSFEDVAF